MSASTPALAPGGGPGHAPPTHPAGGDDHDDSSSSPPLLDLFERFPDLFEKYVLERLDPTTRASLARTGSACWDLVFPTSIFPFGLLHAETPPAAGAARVFKLVDFLGSAERLAWAKANGCPWNAGTCDLAAQEGNLVALQWLRAHGCRWNEWTCYAAAGGGHLEALMYAREHGCPWDSRTCYYAARGGHLAVLRWAREHDCPWDWLTCELAARGGHLLKWARTHGCPWIKGDCDDVSQDHPETLAWVRQQPRTSACLTRQRATRRIL